MALGMKNGENATFGQVVRLGDATAMKVSFAVEVWGYRGHSLIKMIETKADFFLNSSTVI